MKRGVHVFVPAGSLAGGEYGVEDLAGHFHEVPAQTLIAYIAALQ